MHSKSRRRSKKATLPALSGYDDVLAGIVDLLETARRTSARAVNAVMTTSYWEIGRRIAVGGPLGELPLVVGVFKLRQLLAGPGGNFSGIDALADVVRQSQQGEGPAHLGGRHGESFSDLLAGPAVQLHQGGVSWGFFDGLLSIGKTLVDLQIAKAGQGPPADVFRERQRAELPPG